MKLTPSQIKEIEETLCRCCDRPFTVQFHDFYYRGPETVDNFPVRVHGVDEVEPDFWKCRNKETKNANPPRKS